MEAKKASGKGYISEEIHAHANKIESPIVSGLLVAARKGQTSVVLEAIAKRGGAHPPQDTVDRHGRNCLQLACLYGHYETALVILQSNKVNINATNKRGLTALHDACTEGHTSLALLLLSMGASVKAITKDGWSCLMCACSNGHFQLASILIAIGCEINATTSIGLSALHIAAWKGQSAVVTMLIRSGTNVLAESKNGKTALDLAREERQSECIDVLQAAVSKESENLGLRISALEGQLRNSQEQLSIAATQHEQTLEKEREMNKEALVKLEKSKDQELDKSRQKLKTLDEKVNELQALLKRSINSPPLTMETLATPPPTKEKRAKNKDIFAVVKSEAKRSASYSDLVSIQDNTSPKTSKKNHKPAQKKCSIDSSAERRISVERRSITELVTESLLNPGSMAAIRQELKADNLTPKIQRKLKNQTNQTTTLPSLSNGSSPTHHTDNVPESSVSPKGSPTATRPRWTNPMPSLKDSAI